MDKKEKVRRVMDDISSNVAQYHDFVMDCVWDSIEQWDDDQLNNWLGIDESEK